MSGCRQRLPLLNSSPPARDLDADRLGTAGHGNLDRARLGLLPVRHGTGDR